MLLDLIFTCTEKDCLMKWKHFRFLQVKVAKLRPPMTRELDHSKRCLYCFPSDKIINFAFFFGFLLTYVLLDLVILKLI